MENENGNGEKEAQTSQAVFEIRAVSKAEAQFSGGENGVSSSQAITGEKVVLNFSQRFGVEEPFVQAIKKVVYEFSGRISVAQMIGCFEIAKNEIVNEQRK